MQCPLCSADARTTPHLTVGAHAYVTCNACGGVRLRKLGPVPETRRGAGGCRLRLRLHPAGGRRRWMGNRGSRLGRRVGTRLQKVALPYPLGDLVTAYVRKP